MFTATEIHAVHEVPGLPIRSGNPVRTRAFKVSLKRNVVEQKQNPKQPKDLDKCSS